MRGWTVAAGIAAAWLLGGCATLNDRSTAEDGDDSATTLPIDLVELDAYRETPTALPDSLPHAPRADLWDRIRDGFEWPAEERDAIARERGRFAASEQYWERVTERAKPFMHYIIDEIEARGLPTELALVPIVESAFRPFAYSHGSAAGVWQFIPATGEYYGLEQNWWYDGRRDVIAATNAALTYLERLNGMFDGNWLLSIAAYNAGEGTVLRAMRRNEQRGRPTDFWSLPLPAETRTYVPRVLALRDLIAEPELYAISLAVLPNEAQIEAVEIDSQIDLALAADLAGLELEELHRLNPGFNRWATPPGGPHRLVLPHGNAARFLAALDDIPTSERVRWERHQVQSGDSLSAIARQYRTRVDVIRDVNDLAGDTIRAGSTLVVPVASRPDSDYVLSASQRRATARGRSRAGERRHYEVQPGDSFWAIARRYGVGVRELARWNGTAPGDTLRAGDRLVIWSEGTAASGGPSERLQSVGYTVRSGDSLYRIANRFNVSVADLRRWNELPAEGYLQPGQKLELQVDVTQQSGI